MSRSNKLKLLLLASVIAFLSIGSVAIAKSWPSKSIDDVWKTWKVTLSQSVQKDSVTDKTVYILENNKKIKTKASLSADGRTIEIKPELAYQPGKEYELKIEKSLKSISGRALKEPVSMRFHVTEANTPIQSISQVSGSGFINFKVKTTSEVYTVKINSTEMQLSDVNEFSQGFFETFKPGQTVTIHAYGEKNNLLETQTHTITE